MNETITLEKLALMINEIAVGHEMVNYCGFGDKPDMSGVKFPYIWMQPDTSTVLFSANTSYMSDVYYGLTLYVYDKIDKGDGNFRHVISDCEYILATIIAHITKHPKYGDFDITIDQDITITPVMHDTDDDAAGCMATINFKVPFRYSNCNIPIELLGDYTTVLNTDITTHRLQGQAGPQGFQGPTGSVVVIDFLVGPTGPQGDQGPQGFQGVQGAAGSNGVQGFQGDSGMNGINGATGYQGYQGSTGVQGFQGSTGNTGATGYQGYQGSAGVQGFQGNNGTNGTVGATGYQGYQGSNGLNGATGYQGFQGVAGSTGSQGIQGTQGFQGNNGTNGTVGATGYQGYQGPQGPAGAGSGGTSVISYVPSLFSSTSTTAVPISGMSFSVGANELWQFEFVLFGQAGSSSGLYHQIGAPSGCVIESHIFANSNSLTTFVSGRNNAINVDAGIVLWNITGSPEQMVSKGIIASGASAGNIEFKLKNATGTTTFYVFKYSYVKATKIS